MYLNIYYCNFLWLLTYFYLYYKTFELALFINLSYASPLDLHFKGSDFQIQFYLYRRK